MGHGVGFLVSFFGWWARGSVPLARFFVGKAHSSRGAVRFFVHLEPGGRSLGSFFSVEPWDLVPWPISGLGSIWTVPGPLPQSFADGTKERQTGIKRM